MYSSSDDLTLIILIIAIPILLILLAGLILSIVIFFKRSRTAEILSWIFNSIWFIFDQFLVGAGVFKKAEVPNFLIFPILLTFFLLLQYRCNLSSGNHLKMWYAAKTSIILVMFYQLSYQTINLIIQRYYDAMGKFPLNLAIPLTTLTFTVLISALTAFKYLQRIGQPPVATHVLKNTAIFLVCVFVCAELVGRAISFVEIWGLGDLRAEFISRVYFNVMSVLIGIGYSLLCILFGSLIAGYTYLGYAKNKVAPEF